MILDPAFSGASNTSVCAAFATVFWDYTGRMVFSLTGSGKSVDIYDEFYILCMATVKLDSRAIGTFC